MLLQVKQLVEANAYMNKQLQETRDTCRQLSDESIEFQKGWDDARLENERISAALKQLTASQVRVLKLLGALCSRHLPDLSTMQQPNTCCRVPDAWLHPTSGSTCQ